MSPEEREVVLLAAHRAARRPDGRSSTQRALLQHTDDLLSRFDSASSSSDDDEGVPARPTLKLDTDWGAQRRNKVRQRERALLDAGWLPRAGPVGEHPRWLRMLPDGRVQSLTVPGSPSDCRHWANQTAKLRTLDSEALGKQ